MSISWLDNPSALDPAFAGSATQKSKQLRPLFGEQGFSFKDFLDIINPLQHLPVIGSLFRDATESDINPGARLIGGALYGGPAGLALAAMNTDLAERTGKDMGEHLMAALAPSPAATATIAAAVSPEAVRHYADASKLARATDPFGYIDRGLA